MANYDVVLLTQKEYINPGKVNDYIGNVLQEDRLVAEALETLNLKVTRVGWDDPKFDWSETKCVLIRAVWDYFERFEEFKPRLKYISTKTRIINPPELIWWNIDKHYLGDLESKGINIVPTEYIESNTLNLKEAYNKTGFKKAIIKPAIAGAARHTYIVEKNNVSEIEEKVGQIMKKEAFMLQPFITSIIPKGEVSHMIFDGQHTHSILKRAKVGDFRVQDDFGGTVHEYTASEEEKSFAKDVFAACSTQPLYGRVDVVWDNDNKLAVAELEIIEPELWFRECPEAANVLAKGIYRIIR